MSPSRAGLGRRRPGGAVALAAGLLVLAGCGGDDPTVASAGPATAAATASPAAGGPSPGGEDDGAAGPDLEGDWELPEHGHGAGPTLGAGGSLGSAGALAPAEEAMAVLAEGLGEPDSDTGWQPTPDCRAVTAERTLVYGDLRVHLQDGPLPEPAGGGTSRHLAGWRYGPATAPEPDLGTDEGLHLGATPEEAEAAYGDRVTAVPDEAGGLVLELFEGDVSNLLFVFADGRKLSEMVSGSPACLG